MNQGLHVRAQWIARWVIGVLLLAAALPKLAAPQEFALAVFRYHLLPNELINLAALVLPWLELVMAVALLLPAPAWHPAAAVLVVGLLFVFTGAIAISLARGLDIDCGCFTLKPGMGHIGAWNMGRNLVLSAVTLWAVWRPRVGQKSDSA